VDTNINSFAIKKDMELQGHSPNFKNLFSDKRLEKRAARISQSLLMSRTSSVKGATMDEAEQKGFYRFLDNEKVTEELLMKEMTLRCGTNVSNRDVLVIEDSSSFGLSKQSKHKKKNSGLGLVGNKIGTGFHTHCSLVLDAHLETMLGFSDVQLWHRTEDKSNNITKVYKKQPIEEKESYKWIKASLASKEVLHTAKSLTIIQDREGDIYEQFCLVPDNKTHLIIRNRDNRKLTDGQKLHETLSQMPSAGTYQLAIAADIRKERIKRIATLEIRYKKIMIKKPDQLKRTDIAKTLELYVVEAKEINTKAKDAIKWRLLTTREVRSIDDALLIIQYYKKRWYIEQLFRLLKKQGFRIEDTQLLTGWAIRKLTVLILNAALRVMQLYMAYGKEESQPIEEVFTSDEIKCLNKIEQNLLKETPKVINTFNKSQLSWASWIIARLGGWKGNAKQRRAGPITIKRGLEKFGMIYQGWKLSLTG